MRVKPFRFIFAESFFRLARRVRLFIADQLILPFVLVLICVFLVRLRGKRAPFQRLIPVPLTETGQGFGFSVLENAYYCAASALEIVNKMRRIISALT